jgi:hypothetical protein
MTLPTLRTVLAALVLVASTAALHAQLPKQQPTVEQLKSWVAIRQQRVDLLRDEVKQIDARLESRLDVIIDALKSIGDSKDSRTKVARMKEDTGKRLMNTIEYYDQKRAAMKEELRQPRLRLTEEEKKQIIAVFDARIEKRAQQILALNKSMPTHKDYQQYKATGGGWWGTDYQRNENYEQNQRMTTHSNTQRDALLKQLDASMARLDRQSRTLKTQIAAASDPLQRKTLNEELNKTESLITERRKQRLEVLAPAATPTRSVALKEAMDMDETLQTAINELKREFTTLFARYNTLLAELSTLHLTEDALAAASKKR